jgi:hypothetical protein
MNVKSESGYEISFEKEVLEIINYLTKVEDMELRMLKNSAGNILLFFVKIGDNIYLSKKTILGLTG